MPSPKSVSSARPAKAAPTSSPRCGAFLCVIAALALGLASCSDNSASTGTGAEAPDSSSSDAAQADTAEPDADASTDEPDADASQPDTGQPDGGRDDVGQTPDAGDEEPPVVRLVVMGDTGEGNDAQHRVAAGAQARCDRAGGCHGFLMLGDNIYDTGPESVDDPQFTTKIDEPYRVLKYGAPPEEGQPDERERMPIYVSLGNHDLGGAGLNRSLIDHYKEYAERHDWFYFPSEWWEKKIDFVHLMALETNSLAYLGTNYDEHGQMVEGVLDSTDAHWTIAFGHHPYRSDGQHGNAGSYEGIPGDLTVNGGEFRKWIDEYVCNRVDFYLSGHDHNRQWFNSVPEIPSWQPFWEDEETYPCNSWFAVSGAGAKLRDMEDRDNDLAFGEATLGFLFMEFHPDRVVAEYCDADGNTEWVRTLSRHQTLSAEYDDAMDSGATSGDANPQAPPEPTRSEVAQQAAADCQSGSAKACYELGDMLHGGDGIARDNQLSVELIKLACDADFGRACHDLGARYQHGLEVEADLQKARSYYARGCEHYESAACHMLGVFARDGIGVAVNTELAERHFERACTLGFEADCDALAGGIHTQIGRHEAQLPADASDAAVTQARICDGGAMSGCVQLARAYERGEGVPVDAQRARELYETACDWGALEACEAYRPSTF